MSGIVVASGAVVWREREGATNGGVELLLIHRPAYDDWTFPKGKANRGERPPATASREVLEETGLQVALGTPLPATEYAVNAGIKLVRYWSAEVVGEALVPFAPNYEVDELQWVRPRDAAKLLSYHHDRELLANFRELKKRADHRTQTLVILRHAKAYMRERWHGEEAARGLTAVGAAKAKQLARTLEAYGVHTMVTSPTARCVATVQPFAERSDLVPKMEPRLMEGVSPKDVRKAVLPLLDKKRPVALCSHRPTIPAIFETIGLEPVELEPGEAFVVHHHNGQIVATELIS